MAEQSRAVGVDTRPWRFSFRLTFHYTGERITLVSAERLQIIAPPSVTAKPERGKADGFWLEVQDINERVLFYRLMHNPLNTAVEAYQPDGSIRRFIGPPTEGEFEVLVPDIPEAASVVLFGSIPTPAALSEMAPAKELGRFPLRAGPSGEPQ
jgi:hypothetical protein